MIENNPGVKASKFYEICEKTEEDFKCIKEKDWETIIIKNDENDCLMEKTYVKQKYPALNIYEAIKHIIKNEKI